MILQALKEYYDRELKLPNSKIPHFGWEWKEIQYVIVIDEEGNPRDIQDTTEDSEKGKRFHSFYVPKAEDKSCNTVANFLWGNLEYAVGIVPKNISKEKTEERHNAFRKRLEELGETNDDGICALKKFVALSLEEKLEKFEKLPAEKQKIWDKVKKKGKVNVTFKLLNASDIIVSSSQFVQCYERYIKNQTGTSCFCLVSGEYDKLEETHPKINGIKNGQPSGTSLVSFNKDAYVSFGKKQGANAPVGKRTTFAYTTALNKMLHKDSSNHLYLGDTTVVFWGQKGSEIEENLTKVFNPDKNIKEVRSLFESIYGGIMSEPRKKNHFYVLGLAANNARIIVRFWIVKTIQEMAGNIVQYFDDIEIVNNTGKDFLTLLDILRATAVGGEIKNIPKNLESEITRAILTGARFPDIVLQSVITRIRADKGLKVTFPQASLLKAYLNRHFSNPSREVSQSDFYAKTTSTSNSKGEISVSLDRNNLNIGYNLGRLFRILEDIQYCAVAPKSTIRERFYGAASCTPAVVFPNLIRLSNHHLAKLDGGLQKYFEDLLGEVFSKFNEMPTKLELLDQARFAIGYYHQRESRPQKESTINTDIENQEEN